MNIIENIKEFLKENGLNWTGDIITHRKEDFRPAVAEDFRDLNNADFLISFGEDGEIALSIEVDLINFKIYGESFDIACSCYVGNNQKNKKLCRERDLSKDWIKFQLEHSGLLYAAALRERCKEEINKVENEEERRVGQLKRKIEYLNRNIERTHEDSQNQINEIKKLEKMAKKYEDLNV